MTTWVERWNDVIAAEPDLPGVWRRKEGGFRIRGRVTDERTGRMRGVNRALPECKRAREALAELTSELVRVREGAGNANVRTIPRFEDWAVTVFERKIATAAIVSAAGRAKWDWALRVHLIPAFGPMYVDKISRETVEQWKERELLRARAKAKDAKRDRVVAGGRYKPHTVNSLLEILRQVMGEASDAFNFADPCRKLTAISKRHHRTYTYEAPNSIKPADVPKFLDEMRVLFPEHYAFAFLGFTTGLRPSSLRPLRRRGQEADVKWEEGKLLVRRSNTHKTEVMDSTKTGVDQVITLDERQLDILRWHVAELERDNVRRAKRSPEQAAAMANSDLLFPATPTRWNHGGGYRSQSCLDKAFKAVSEKLKLGYRVTPRAMRRTYQDLARAASVSDIVTRSISGHATPEMQRHYSTVSSDEQRAGIAKVIDIATGKERAA